MGECNVSGRTLTNNGLSYYTVGFMQTHSRSLAVRHLVRKGMELGVAFEGNSNQIYNSGLPELTKSIPGEIQKYQASTLVETQNCRIYIHFFPKKVPQ